MTEPHNLTLVLARLRAQEEPTMWSGNPANAFRSLVMEWNVKVDAEVMRRIWETCNEPIVNEEHSTP